MGAWIIVGACAVWIFLTGRSLYLGITTEEFGGFVPIKLSERPLWFWFHAFGLAVMFLSMSWLAVFVLGNVVAS